MRKASAARIPNRPTALEKEGIIHETSPFYRMAVQRRCAGAAGCARLRPAARCPAAGGCPRRAGADRPCGCSVPDSGDCPARPRRRTPCRRPSAHLCGAGRQHRFRRRSAEFQVHRSRHRHRRGPKLRGLPGAVLCFAGGQGPWAGPPARHQPWPARPDHRRPCGYAAHRRNAPDEPAGGHLLRLPPDAGLPQARGCHQRADRLQRCAGTRPCGAGQRHQLEKRAAGSHPRQRRAAYPQL